MLNVNFVHSELNTESHLWELFPVLSVSHSCASQSTIYMYAVAANLFEESSVYY